METAEVFHDRHCCHLWRFTPAAQQGAVAETDRELRSKQPKNKIGFGYQKNAGVCAGRDKENAGKL